MFRQFKHRCRPWAYKIKGPVQIQWVGRHRILKIVDEPSVQARFSIVRQSRRPLGKPVCPPHPRRGTAYCLYSPHYSCQNTVSGAQPRTETVVLSDDLRTTRWSCIKVLFVNGIKSLLCCIKLTPQNVPRKRYGLTLDTFLGLGQHG